MQRITVLLADDYAIEREAFRKIIGLETDLQVVGEAENGRQAVLLAKKLMPDVVLMDVTMPLLNGLEAARQINKALPSIKVLMIAAHSDYTLVQNAIACGVAGFLLKQISAQDVCRAIRDVHEGITIFNPGVYRCFDKLDRPSPCHRVSFEKPIVELSSREMEVLQLIAEGNANKQIAAELGISMKTVEKHRQLLMERLDIHSTAGLTRYAIGAGIVGSSVHLSEFEGGFPLPPFAPVSGLN
jgi:DNA-binding NarL/FixJ family response regulator